MTDKENLKMGLEEVSDLFFEMYRKETDQYKAIKAKEYSDIVEDAISLLKEQEEVEPNRGLAKTQKAWFCGACGFRLNRAGRFCPKCGRLVKWNA